MSDDITITCTCGSPMTVRVNRLNASTFLGCTRFPDCTETQKVPAYVEVVRAGGVQLPGFEDVPERPDEKRPSWTA